MTTAHTLMCDACGTTVAAPDATSAQAQTMTPERGSANLMLRRRAVAYRRAQLLAAGTVECPACASRLDAPRDIDPA